MNPGRIRLFETRPVVRANPFSLVALVFLLPFFSLLYAQEENLVILHEPGTLRNDRTWFRWSGAPLMLVNHLNRLSIDCIERREDKIAKLKSGEDWRQRQAKVREYFENEIGPWPARTDLKPRITGVLRKDGFRVEKVLFESMPGYPVTGALFIPEGHRGRGPAILKVIGHSADAFRRDIYQNVILNLVHKGFIVLAIDPMGQGERVQYFDPGKGRSEVGGSTSEHSHVGVQCFLIGRSLARYFTWDGIRAMDYLISRPEVDPLRIGATGLSGGGTQSSYLGAMDDRVLAVAPAGYITSYRRLLETIGPQDGEQIFPRGLASGIDHADLLEVRAPKPTLHVTTTRDFFSIQGARETEREVKRAFSALGRPENYHRVEDDYGHGFTRKNNEATYAFFQKHLNLPGDPTEHDYPYLTKEELTVTPTGQVSTSMDCETAFSLNRKEAQPILRSLAESRLSKRTHLSAVLKEARRLSGYVEAASLHAEPFFLGQYQREGYRVEKWALRGEGEYMLPTLVFVPDGEGPFPAIIHAHESGKQVEAGVGGGMEALVKKGFVVAAVDLLGFGETRFYRNNGHADVQPFFNALLAGRSIVGINAGDALQVFGFLRQREDVLAEDVGAIAVGATGPAILHAAAFEKDFAWIVLHESLASYASLVENRIYDVNANSLVAGALTAYDLPDLVASLAPRRCVVSMARNHMNKSVDSNALRSSLLVALTAYEEKQSQGNIRIVDEARKLEDLVAWCASVGNE